MTEVNAPNRFWDWFQTNSSALLNVKSADEQICHALARELRRACDGLTFEFGPREIPREVMITADGIRKFFPAVQELVAEAPKMAGWSIIAFRPRKDCHNAQLRLAYRGRDLVLSVSSLKFRATEAGIDCVDIELFIPDLDEEDPKPLQMASFLLLDSLVGEYDVGTRVGHIEWYRMPVIADELQPRPLVELRDLIDGMKPPPAKP